MYVCMYVCMYNEVKGKGKAQAMGRAKATGKAKPDASHHNVYIGQLTASSHQAHSKCQLYHHMLHLHPTCIHCDHVMKLTAARAMARARARARSRAFPRPTLDG